MLYRPWTKGCRSVRCYTRDALHTSLLRDLRSLFGLSLPFRTPEMPSMPLLPVVFPSVQAQMPTSDAHFARFVYNSEKIVITFFRMRINWPGFHRNAAQSVCDCSRFHIKSPRSHTDARCSRTEWPQSVCKPIRSHRDRSVFIRVRLRFIRVCPALVSSFFRIVYK